MNTRNGFNKRFGLPRTKFAELERYVSPPFFNMGIFKVKVRVVVGRNDVILGGSLICQGQLKRFCLLRDILETFMSRNGVRTGLGVAQSAYLREARLYSATPWPS